METTLIFLEGHELPFFAAFDLSKNADGRAALKKYFRRHTELAREHGVGFAWKARPGGPIRIGPPRSASSKRTFAA